MPLVRNKSAQSHRYPLWETGNVIVWLPGETQEVSPTVAAHVCRVHPDKLELVGVPVAPVPESATETFNPGLPRAINRQQRGGRRS